MTVRILTGDVRDKLRELPDESVHCVVTSPPYWGLRDYGHEGQLGLEDTPDEYVAAMVEVFREVRRVLREDGTLWLNIGDTYAANRGYQVPQLLRGGPAAAEAGAAGGRPSNAASIGLKIKDLVGIPWMLAFALRADGWFLRQDIIWNKPNPMPESVTDRCTKAHEYVFLLSKAWRYYFDATAIAEPVSGDPEAPRNRWDTKDYEVPGQRPQKREGRKAEETPRNDGGRWNENNGRGFVKRSGNKERKPASARGVPVDTNGSTNGAVAGSIPWEGSTRNKRSVWEITVKAFPEAHFATFPPELPELCIKAGCPAGGVVLDPFGGAGTTGLVADRLQRDAILIELNPEYAAMAERRIRGDSPLFAQVGT